MHDLAHVRGEDCLADSLTKHSAKADELIKAVLTGNLMNVDANPPFRTMLQNKAFLVEWLAQCEARTRSNRVRRSRNSRIHVCLLGNLGMIHMSMNFQCMNFILLIFNSSMAWEVFCM